MDANEAKFGRPLGISILSWLAIVSGILVVCTGLFSVIFKTMDSNFQRALSALSFSWALFVMSIIFLCVLMIASGVGMLQGKRWGWYLGSFYIMYSILRDINAFLLVDIVMQTMRPEDAATMRHGPAFYHMKFGFRIVTGILLYVYFFKTNVRMYFGLKDIKTWKTLGAQIGIGIVLVLVSIVIGTICK